MPRSSGSSSSRTACGAVILALVLAACPGDGGDAGPGTPSPSPVPTPRAGGEIIVAYPNEPATLDPFDPAGEAPATRDIARLLMPAFEQLGAAGSRSLWLLAEEPVVEQGPPFSVRVRLREDAVWSDGTRITVEDLRFTWRHAARAGVAGYDRIERVVAESPAQARLVFGEPYEGWRDLFGAGLGVLPAHALAGDARLERSWPVSGGPFVLQRWRRGLDIVLVRNERTWGDRDPAIDRLRIVFVPDQIGALELLRRGEVDVLGPYAAPDWQRRARNIDGANVSAETGATWAALLLNTGEAPFDDRRVRRALAHAIDRARIVGGIVGSEGATLQTLRPADAAGGGTFGVYGDEAQARALLDRAGWSGSPRRKAGETLNPTLAVISDDLPLFVARAIQFQSLRVGFDLQAVPLDVERLWGEWLQGEQLRAALVVWREPPGGADRPRYGLDADPETLAQRVPAIPLYRVAVTLAARDVAGVCASASADGPFWNAHIWTRGDVAVAACPTLLPAAA